MYGAQDFVTKMPWEVPEEKTYNLSDKIISMRVNKNNFLNKRKLNKNKKFYTTIYSIYK